MKLRDGLGIVLNKSMDHARQFLELNHGTKLHCKVVQQK